MPIAQRTLSFSRSGMFVRVVLAVLCAGLFLPCSAQAAGRVLKIKAPADAVAHTSVEVTVKASTDLGSGEQIGFLHVETSVDGGKTWTGVVFEDSLGSAATRPFSVTTGDAGVSTLVRARVAFRGGAAGDVDFAGGAIKWDGTWSKWSEPPARTVVIKVSSN